MSLVLGANDVTTQLPLLVGISCAEVIEELTDVIVSIKWPNDLMIQGRKVGGVLVEMGDGWVVAGIGINVRRSPSESLQAFSSRALTATSIAEHSDRISEIPGFAGLFAQRILARLDAGKGQGGVVDSFSARDMLRGLRVHTDELGIGIARGIDECGMLLLEREDGSIVEVRSGSVRSITSSEEEE
jgi:BirA family biotin operon repressor/biotin-[acetyl-CoA-carboxylase] ligase